MVSGLNRQLNKNLHFGANNAYNNGMQNAALNRPAAQNPQTGQNFGQLTAKNDTFESTDPNFGAIDRETLEKGAEQVQKQVEDNFVIQMIKNMFGIDIHNPKKTMISLGLTLVTVLGLAKLGNSKFSTEKLADLGIDLSNALKNNNTYMNITGKMKSAKDSVVNFLRKSKTIDDIFETFANRKAKPVNQWAKGTGSGLKRIFSLTPPDTAKTALDKLADAGDVTELARLRYLVNSGEKAQVELSKLREKGGNIAADKLQALTEAINNGKTAAVSCDALQAKVDGPKLESMKKIVGDSKAKEVLDFITQEGADSVEVSNKLLHSIGQNFGVIDKEGKVIDEKGLQTILRQLKAGKITGLDGKLNIDVSEFTNIRMDNNKGPIKIVSDWWPVNFVDDIGRKIRGDKWKPFGRGNLGDSLIKHSIISGQATDTLAGKFTQQLALFPSEAISNFGNDKSGLGFFLCGMIMNLYNNVQDAPKEKKAATMADDFVGSIGNLAIVTPLAVASMYGLATLKNVEGKSFVSKYLLKPVGKFFGAGLDQKWKNVIANPSGSKVKDIFRQIPGRTVGFAGGLMRLLLVMLVFQGIFNKPFKNVVNKIFGKPYDPAEEEQMKNMQAQAQNMEAVMKDLNLTEEQMVAKLQANPEFVAALQNDPEALKAIQNDPTLLLKLIAQLPDNNSAVGTQNPAGMNNGNIGAAQENKFSSVVNTPSPLLSKHINGGLNSVQGQNQTMPGQMPVNNAQSMPNTPLGAQGTMAPAQQNMQNQALGQNNLQADQNPLAQQNNTVQNNAVNNANEQNKNPDEPVRTYIPSSKPFNYVEGDKNTIKPEEITNQNVQAMLSKADRAEQEAMKILG